MSTGLTQKICHDDKEEIASSYHEVANFIYNIVYTSSRSSWHVEFRRHSIKSQSSRHSVEPQATSNSKILHSAGLKSAHDFQHLAAELTNVQNIFATKILLWRGLGRNAGHGEVLQKKTWVLHSDLLIKNFPLDICGPSHATAWGLDDYRRQIGRRN